MAHGIFLVEIDLGYRLRKWSDQAIRFDSEAVFFDDTSQGWDGKHGVFSRALSSAPQVVGSVTEDDAALTSVASAALVESTIGSWYYDAAAGRVWIHTAGNVDSVSGLELIVVAVETLAKERTVVKDRSGVPVVWDGRVLAIPSVSQEVQTGELAALGSAVSFGELVIANGDQRYTETLGLRVVQGQEVRIYLGDPDAAFSTFTLWAKALAEAPVFDVETLTIPLGSIARRLDGPIVTAEFQTSTYPDMDAAIRGVNIPKCWGPVFGAEAFRIASGRWKVSSLAMTAITTAKRADGTTVTITGTDLALGEFTVAAAEDAEARLYVDGTGVNVSLPGALLNAIATDSALAAASVDAAAVTALNAARAVNGGLQVRVGSIREALDLVAQSAFAEWAVDRQNVLTMRVRRRDEGNLVTNAGFETDTTGWSADNGASIARTTALAFRGSASLQITKAAGNGLGRAFVAGLALTAGTVYTATCLAALVSGTTAAFRLGIAMPDGREYLSDPVTLSATAWTRVRVVLSAAALASTIAWDDEVRTFDLTDVFFSSGGAVGALVAYPEYGGAGAPVVAVDEVELTEAIAVDDSVARLGAAGMAERTLWQVRAGWQFDVRTGERRFASASDSAIQDIYKTAESRSILGVLQANADAATVAQAALDYFVAGRMRVELELLDFDFETGIEVGDVVSLDPPVGDGADRRPTLPDQGTLYRVVGFREDHAGDAPGRAHVTAEAVYDPITDQMTITAS